ncbi:fimbria/pilus periplasmic chaperone [Escherichia coli]|uniref:fimbria/pilus periplasmic chaperone n=1 Tax=Escherichia coli TaxID=562 RepID=UPI000BE153B9|nr:fimbria/pilus periplasmic chaperone [Escherichia coli]
MKGNALTLLIGVLVEFSMVSALAANNVETVTKNFSLHLGASRVIYPQGAAGATLAVINDHDYPMLVQSEVFLEDQKSSAPFVVTPPLFRIDGRQSSRLRIVQTGGDFPSDRESLQWLCVKGIPPKEGDKWAEGSVDNNKVSLQVQFSVSNCIKLFLRPSAVKGHPDDVAGQVEWLKTGSKLKGTNPTPFYINLSELKVGGGEVTERHYIAPFSSYEYKLPSEATGKVQWKVITDYGGISKSFESKLSR